ncbi:MAG: hypothetical protein JWN24_4162 [Phycisphaerales bacterium]|nr:hypothetical protein [Phycisphaerales bacterium]
MFRPCLSTAAACILAIAAAARAGPAAAEPTTDADDAKEIQSLVTALGDNDFHKRSAAQRELAGFGNEAIPALEEAAHGGDPEVSSRASAAIQAIRSSARETRVTLHLHDVTAQDAIQALSKQAGLRLVPMGAVATTKLARTKLSLDARRMPFWAALLKVCEAADLCPMPNGFGRDVLGLGDEEGTWCSQFVTVHGPFAVSLVSLQQDARLMLGKPDPFPPGPELVMALYAEQRVRVQSISKVTVSRCEDDSGFPIGADVPRNEIPIAMRTRLPIQLHPEDAKRIALIEGEIVLRLEESPQHVELPDILGQKNLVRVAGDARLSIKDCRQTAHDRWALRVTVLRDGRDDASMAEVVERVARSKPQLADSSSRELDRFSTVSRRDLPGGEGVELEFSWISGNDRGRGAADEPAKLTWDVPTSTRETKIPFSFKDVPLP